VKSALVAAALAVATTSYAAPPAAERAFAELRYDEALRLLDAAWHHGGNDAAELRSIFALAGQAAAAIGDDAGAQLWFERWLCLEPAAALPAGTSPKLTAAFAAARDGLAGGVLVAHMTRVRDEVDVTIVADPLGLAASARGGGETVAISHQHATLPAAEHVELLDRYANELAVVVPDPSLPQQPAPLPAAPHHTLAGRWSTWAIATGALAAVGAGSLWVAVDARSQLRDLDAHSTTHEFHDTLALQSRFDRAQWAARFSLAGAAVTAAVATTLWLRTRGEGQLTVGGGPQGGSVSWEVPF
jgi:hypothetical protein